MVRQRYGPNQQNGRSDGRPDDYQLHMQYIAHSIARDDRSAARYIDLVSGGEPVVSAAAPASPVRNFVEGINRRRRPAARIGIALRSDGVVPGPGSRADRDARHDGSNSRAGAGLPG